MVDGVKKGEQLIPLKELPFLQQYLLKHDGGYSKYLKASRLKTDEVK